MYQEINLSDKSLWQQFKDYWADGDFEEAYFILSEAQLDNKVVISSIFNDITDMIYDLETQSDPTFKSNRIKLSSIPPEDLDIGEVYFQIK